MCDFSVQSLIGKVTGGAIIGEDGGIYDATPGFYGLTEEFNQFKEAFQPSSKLVFKGIVFLGETYIVTGIKENTVIAKKGTNTLIIIKCPRCLIIGFHDDQINFDDCYQAMTELASRYS